MKAAFLSSKLISTKGSARPSASITHPFELITDEGSRPRVDPVEPAEPSVARRSPVLARVTHRAEPQPVRTVKPVRSEPRPETLVKDNLGRVRTSLRMTPERHLELKILSALSRKSIQALLSEALDSFLSDQATNSFKGQCACLKNKKSV